MKHHDIQLTGSISITGSLTVPVGTTDERPLNPKSGSIRMNTTTGVLEIYTAVSGAAWESVGEQVAVTPVPSVDVEYLLVAGGGGNPLGGNNGAGNGGGGAGGYISSSYSNVTSGSSFTITIGAGTTTSGGDSTITSDTFTDQTAVGGGEGGSGRYANAGSGTTQTGKDGGSGGGGGNATSGDVSGGAATTGQGNAGGSGVSNEYAGGGGGGAGAGGASASSTTGGDGGDGLQSSITGTATYYAGGGGGGTYSGTAGTGGQGGGTDGKNYSQGQPSDGTANTGGGAGGLANKALSAPSGGSGVAIFRYPSSSISCVGGIELKSSNGDRIHQFNSSATLQVGGSSDFLSPERFPRSSVSSPSIYINPRSIGENGSFVYIPDLGSVGRDFYVGGSGTKINTTGSLADAIDTPYVGASGNSRGFAAGGTSMTTVYSDYNTNQNCSFNCFFRYDPSMQTDTNYPLISMITPSTSNNSTAYYAGWQIAVWRGGLADTGKVYSQIYDSSGTGLFSSGRNSTTVTSGDQWYMLTVTLSYGASGVQKMYINGSLEATSDTVNITSFGGSSNRIHLGESYYSATGYNPGGMTFGVTQWWFGTELNSSEIANLYTYYKSDYGLS